VTFTRQQKTTKKGGIIMANNPKPPNGPSGTGKPSGGGRGNNPPKPGK
jgi:hypothetical protein